MKSRESMGWMKPPAAMNERGIKKLYYSISEVSHLTSLKPYILRQWENEFHELRPSKNRSGNRVYRLQHIKLIFLIKKLLYVDKYTVEGARRQLKVLKRDGARRKQLCFTELLREHLLLEMKKDLGALLQFIRNSNQ